MELNEEKRLIDIENEFISYLQDTNSIKYLSLSANPGGFYSARKIDYIHRWTKLYQSKFYYRLFLLEKWFLWWQKPVTFVTLTSYHDEQIEHQIMLIKKGLRKFLKEMRREGEFLEYLASMDFHHDGYGHYHIIFFCEISEDFRKHIKKKWVEWKIGDSKHGVDFRNREAGEIHHLVNYLFKHAGKIFTGQAKPGWLRFHSVIWKMYHSKENDSGGMYDFPGIRLFSMSKEIAKIMKPPERMNNVIRVVQVGKGSVYDKDTWNDEERQEINKKLYKFLRFYGGLNFG